MSSSTEEESGDESSTTTLGDDASMDLLSPNEPSTRRNHAVPTLCNEPVDIISKKRTLHSGTTRQHTPLHRNASDHPHQRARAGQRYTPKKHRHNRYEPSSSIDSTTDGIEEPRRFGANKGVSSSHRKSLMSPISPATQTLDDLSGMDTEGGGNLRFDLSQHMTQEEEHNNGKDAQSLTKKGNCDWRSMDDTITSENFYRMMTERDKKRLNNGRKSYLAVYYENKTLRLGGDFVKQGDALLRFYKAKALIEKWRSIKDAKKRPTVDQVKTELERRKIRISHPNSVIRRTADDSESIKELSYTGTFQNTADSNRHDEAVEIETKIIPIAPSSYIRFLGNVSAPKKGNVSYSVHLITISEPGSLGLNVRERNDPSHNDLICVVNDVKPFGQGDKYGVKLNDIVCHPPIESASDDLPGEVPYFMTNQIKGANFDEVVQWASSPNRPIIFAVKRIASKTTSASITCKYGENRKLSKKEIDRALQGKGFPLIPFCGKCNNTDATVSHHHVLCPKHHDFNGSGAKERLVLILAGIRDGCKACQREFSDGKKNSDNHVKKCGRSCIHPRKKEILDLESNMSAGTVESCPKSCEEEKEQTSRKTLKTRPSEKSDRSPCHRSDKSASLSKKRKDDNIQLSVLTSRHSSGMSQLTKVGGNNASSKSNGDVNFPRPPPKQVAPLISDTTQVATDHSHKTAQMTLSDNTAKPVWVACPNPWGTRLHCEGDFVLVSPTDYQTAYEIQGPQPQRFVVNPFEEKASPYHRTHISPQHGYRVVRLTRDHLALRSWGFSTTRHEFGGACLLNEIEPFSPAQAAVDVGLAVSEDKFSSALEVNDMIICVNGKEVGGMTEMNLAVELDICGSELIAVVSKCKISTKIERHAWTPIDSEECLHWHEIGLGSAHENPNLTMELKRSDHLGIRDSSSVLQHERSRFGELPRIASSPGVQNEGHLTHVPPQAFKDPAPQYFSSPLQLQDSIDESNKNSGEQAKKNTPRPLRHPRNYQEKNKETDCEGKISKEITHKINTILGDRDSEETFDRHQDDLNEEPRSNSHAYHSDENAANCIGTKERHSSNQWTQSNKDEIRNEGKYAQEPKAKMTKDHNMDLERLDGDSNSLHNGVKNSALKHCHNRSNNIRSNEDQYEDDLVEESANDAGGRYGELGKHTHLDNDSCYSNQYGTSDKALQNTNTVLKQEPHGMSAQHANIHIGIEQDNITEQSALHCTYDLECLGERTNASGQTVKDLKDVYPEQNINRESWCDEEKNLIEDTENSSDRSYTPTQEERQRKPVEDLQSNDSQTRNTDDWEDDENPWLGCVCRKIHESPAAVFWIQCDNCEAWYSCSPDCIGFDENEAKTKSKWECPACYSVTNDAQASKKNEIVSNVSNDKDNLVEMEQSHIPLPVGSIVTVEARTWPGSNKPGGVAKILAYKSSDHNLVYDVSYILGGREFNIESDFISINESIIDYSSPSASTRKSRGRLI